MKKILAFTSIRSDYDLMSPLYKLLNDDQEIDFKILVSGAHLVHGFGYTIEQIRLDNFDILLEVETLLGSDTGLSRVKSASLLLQNSIETVAKFRPDLIIYAGDREDVIMYAIIGGYLNIPTIHFYAGDHVSDGYIDNAIRHATSKLSTAQFVMLPSHKQRLVRMGEESKRVFVIGNIALDRFRGFHVLSKEVLKTNFNISGMLDEFALLIFHPITDEISKIDNYFENILQSLENNNIRTFVSYPNVDPGNSRLIQTIEKYKKNRNFIFYKSLERNLFLSIFKQAKFIIGNSSSGICEAASFKIPAINVGLRQTKRYADINVIFCKNSREEIDKAIKKVCSKEFLKNLKNMENSYGDGRSALKAYAIIKDTNFAAMIRKVKDPLEVEII